MPPSISLLSLSPSLFPPPPPSPAGSDEIRRSQLSCWLPISSSPRALYAPLHRFVDPTRVLDLLVAGDATASWCGRLRLLLHSLVLLCLLNGAVLSPF
uniref:Uncharacterized protein n=1 Tax=Triticum urartu TaxID=4572 RepID=A0A8R7URZ1_TRIUA